eukprot:GHVP01060324.1.p1 GENE.GHVP01060324.1~~GHVP01060324.1.p1  ORF type:complete len:493 (-),score=46.24 GHVP01060324.1:485-1963(-)
MQTTTHLSYIEIDALVLINMDELLPIKLKYVLISFPITVISLLAIIIVEAFKSSKTTYHMVQSILNSQYISLLISTSLVYLAILITLIHIKLLPCDLLEPERDTIIQELQTIVLDLFVIGKSFRSRIDRPSIFLLSLFGGFRIYSTLCKNRIALSIQPRSIASLYGLRLHSVTILGFLTQLVSVSIASLYIEDASLYFFVLHRATHLLFTHLRDYFTALKKTHLINERLRYSEKSRRAWLLITSSITSISSLIHLVVLFYIEGLPFPMIQDCSLCVKHIIEDEEEFNKFDEIYGPDGMPGTDAIINDIPNDSVCPICRDDMDEPSACRKLPCGHVFHTSCLQGWIEIMYSCPSCRVDLRASQNGSISNERAVGTNNFLSRMFFNGQPPEVLPVSRLQEITRNIVGITESEAEQPNARNTNVLSMLSSINNQINTLENRFSESMRELRVQLQEVEEELRRIPSETAVITNTNTEEAPQQESRDNNTSDIYLVL